MVHELRRFCFPFSNSIKKIDTLQPTTTTHFGLPKLCRIFSRCFKNFGIFLWTFFLVFVCECVFHCFQTKNTCVFSLWQHDGIYGDDRCVCVRIFFSPTQFDLHSIVLTVFIISTFIFSLLLSQFKSFHFRFLKPIYGLHFIE